MQRLEKGADYLFISINNLKVVPTHDCYFPTDNERFENGNYFTDAAAAKACLSIIKEEHGETIVAIDDGRERSRNRFIKAVTGLVAKATGKAVQSEDDEDEPEEGTEKKSKKATPEDIVAAMVAAYEKYRETNVELMRKERKVRDSVKDIIKSYNL